MGKRISTKKKLNTKVKAGILSVLGLIILFMGVLIYREVTSKKTSTEEHILYQYTCQPAIQYDVHMIENKIYDSNILVEGLSYSKNLLDYIETRFAIEFQGSEDTETELDYHITLIQRGYKATTDGIAINWTKNHVLKEDTKVHHTEATFSESPSVHFKLDDYQNFAVEANQILGFQLSSDVIVMLEGILSIHTQYGELTTPISMQHNIPLMEDAITITKGEAPAITDSIKEYKEVAIPINQNKIVLFGAVICISIIAMIYLLLSTEAPSIYDIRTAKAKQLLKNYSSRIVAIHNKPNQEFHQTYEMSTMMDLVKVSDEIQKPIYYMYDDFFTLGNYTFHVSDGDDQYIFNSLDLND